MLRRELARPSWKRDDVAVGTATDPYQAIEGKYRLTRRLLEALRDFRTPVSIVTRSPLVCNDLDVLTELGRRAGVTVCISIVTTDARVAREIEPTVALPEQRLRALQTLAEAGIRTGVLLAPILPGITDDPDGLRTVVEASRDHGAHFVGHNVLHLGHITRDSFFQYLRARRPELVPRYVTMYRGKYAPDDYRAGVGQIVNGFKQTCGVPDSRYAKPSQDGVGDHERDQESAQLALFPEP